MTKAGGVGDGLKAENANWTFGGGVAQNFDDHVSKSVPLYREGHKRSTMYAKREKYVWVIIPSQFGRVDHNGKKNLLFFVFHPPFVNSLFDDPAQKRSGINAHFSARKKLRDVNIS